MANWLRLHWKKLMFVALLLGAAGFGFVRKAVEERVTSEWSEVNGEVQSLLNASGRNGGTTQASSSGQGASAQPKDQATAQEAVPGAPTLPAPSATAPVQAEATAAPAQSPAGTAAAKGLIDINTASASRLDELPGIGPGKAQAIVEYRQSKGPFRTPEDLKNVKGIGQKTYDGLKDRITASVAP
ncbi:helix-hairpin-helix domain-containing protein [Paenibacillus mesotrionivorans]|uniref:Helix-hairpin-helix domain-containing protein n=1 Tax=Paenibacillus mesotrionivorans TaxID=3160968 RepID=A0ACC7P5R4_9BACL